MNALKYLAFATCIFLCNAVFAQKKFNVYIKLDTSLILKKIRYQYDNGKKTVFLGDSVSKTGDINIQGQYFSTFATLNVLYVDNLGKLYTSDYLLDTKPAKINIFYNQNVNQNLLHSRLVNARAIYDTTSNEVYRELIHYNKEQFLKTWEFTQAHAKEINGSDSLMKIYRAMLDETHTRTLAFLKAHTNDYFSFWYYKQNIVGPMLNTVTDSAKLKKHLDYFTTVFPGKYTQSFEGKELIKNLKRRINPLKANMYAPSFTVKTIDGEVLKTGDLKGKFVLVDFWATWCAPCMAEVPFVKSLRAKYPKTKLAIVGISADRKVNDMVKTIKSKGMNWYHYFDKDSDIAKLYGVHNYPNYFLIGPDGKIIYKSEELTTDKEELEELLAEKI